LLQILTSIVVASLAIFVGFYLFFFAICIRYVKNKPKNIGASASSAIKEFPTVSMIVPVYNEASVIQRKFENLQALHYPKNKLEVIFVDGGSVDGTAEMIESFATTSDLSIKVVRQGCRKGYDIAIVEGFAESTGEIICFTGAEVEYEPEALLLMIQYFADPKVGAVSGKQSIKNLQEGLSPKLEGAYRNLYDFLREAESYIDSPFNIQGEICVARRNICAHLVEKQELFHRGCIDSCLSFQGKMDGYKTVYEPNAVFYEFAPSSIRESFNQQIRRAATLIQSMMAFKGMILRRKFDAFGMLIMPAHFLMLVVLPFLFLLGSIGALAIIAFNPLQYPILTAAIVITVLATLFSKQIQAFVRTQIVLVITILGMLTGIETQKFKRLHSTRR